jgi:2'-5' RNA ligase
MAQEMRGRPVEAADLHLTLCFLGEVKPDDAGTLIRSALRVPPEHLPLQLMQTDFWSDARALCLLPEAETALAAAANLARQLRAAARDAGIAADPKAFRAHVTVGRKISASAASQRHWPCALPTALPFTADGFALMQGTGESTGRRYAVLHAWPVR